MISIVIPALDEEAFIGRLLYALGRQTKKVDEILVVDGGSRDRTMELASVFPSVRVIQGEPPVGAQRQLGLESVRGDFVFFLDADTLMCPDFIERCVAEMERRRLDAACPRFWPYPGSWATKAVYAFFNGVFILSQSLGGSGGGMCIAARRDFALQIGGFRKDLVYEDIEFIRRASRRGRFGILKPSLLVSDRRFRRHGTLRTFLKYLGLSFFFTLGLFKAAELIGYEMGSRGPCEENVVLVDENGRDIGLAPKRSVHTADTPLHRAFSAFIFRKDGRLLLQRRSGSKQTWPLMWSNSCCGHPLPGEANADAVRRRAALELGLTDLDVWEALPDYRYRAEMNGIVENELCPVYVAVTHSEPRPNPDEVAETRWIEWNEFLDSLDDGPEYTHWCVEEASLLSQSDVVSRVLERCRLDTSQPSV